MAHSDGLTLVNARIAATERRLWRLRLAEAFWPLALLVLLYLALALSGLLDRIDRGPAAVLAIGFVIAGVISFLRGRRRFQRPTREEAEDALDRESEWRPIASLTDQPVDASPAAQTLWQRHRERLLAELKRLNPPFFKPEWRLLDPYALRYVVPIGVMVLAVIAGSSAPGRLQRAFDPDLGALMGADKMVVEAWVTPPEHTGRAPIFLKPGLAGVSVPEGSEITLRTKAPSAPILVLDGKKKDRRIKFTATPDGAFEAKSKIVENTRVTVRWWGVRAKWRLDVTPDTPPEVRFVSTPVVTAKDAAEFTWAVKDDFGVVKLELALSLQTPDPAAPKAEDRVALSLPAAAPVEATDKAVVDLTRHRWAGLPVNLRLIATDGAGREGTSETVPFTLPEKFFLDPLARATQEIRVTVLREPREYKKSILNPGALFQDTFNTAASSRLDLAPPGVQQAALMLDAITWQGERYYENYATFMAFRTAHGVLESAASKAEADAVDSLLWALALKIEYGSAADAARRLEVARAALEQALRNGASEEEIQRRMEAYRDAANEYLAAKMAEAIANGLQQPESDEDREQMAQGPGLDAMSFEEMLNALEDLTETGASEQARKLLSDINNMLENLEFQEGQGSGQGMPGMPGQNAENQSEPLPPEEQELTDAQKRLSEILREQRELNDDTLAEQRGEKPGERGEQGGQPQTQGQGQSGESQQGEGSQAGEGAGEGEDQGGKGGKGARDFGEQEEGNGSGDRLTKGTLAERQAQLGELVEKLAREKGLGKGAGENPLEGKLDGDKLDDIREAQRRAEELLEMGNGARAARNQERATELLSDLSGDLARTLDEMREGREGGEGRAAGETDPFGRLIGGGGTDSNGVEIPAEAERQRAKDILDELRRRYDAADTEEERDYLRRLMDRF